MKLFIDSANTQQIRKINECYPIDGVTTNPSILSNENTPFLSLLEEIKNIIGESKLLFVQTVSAQAEAIVNEAVYIWEVLHKKIVVKIPTTVEGIKAIKILKDKRIPTLATTVYTPMNAYVAAKAGADFVAPYVNRIENLSGDGCHIVNEIKQIFANTNISCKVLAASFKNVQQIKDVCITGVDAITVAPELIEKFLQNPSIERDVKQFQCDWVTRFNKKSLI